jgi:pyridoxal phosphate enzyme (YggS family)
VTAADPGGTDGPGGRDGRIRELRANLAAVLARMDRAARAAGRDPGELTLVAVSKTHPPVDVADLFRLGVGHFAENRAQEAGGKVPAVVDVLGAGRGADPAPRRPAPVWHFVGQLQRNKARQVVEWADWIHSVDRAGLVGALSRAAVSAGRRIDVCVQVCLDDPAGSAGRGGADPSIVPELAALVASSGGLRLAGVMAVAPRKLPPRPAFARLREVSDALRRDHPGAWVISAGMSGDLEVAVAEGATHLRIGTALFGPRGAVP